MTNSDIGEIKTAVILGAGNMAWHLGHSLADNGINISQVYNRSASSGQALARSLQSSYVAEIDAIDRKADLIILAVSDDVIYKIACSLSFLKSGILVHTAGAVSMDILSVNAENFGVFYPLQTFTQERNVSFRNIPFLLEANSQSVLEKLSSLASRLSDHVYSVNSESRMLIHLAAVLSSNFTNHLLTLSEELLSDHNMTLDLLKPLMIETVSKAFDTGPGLAQTGPAVRGSKKVIEKHLQLLEKYPKIKEVYKILSNSIRQHRPGPEVN